MKKFLKIFGLCLLGCGGIALLMCYIFIPNETKAAADVIVDYLNRPLPIIGISVATFGGFALTIFKNTSIGRKTLNELKTDFSNLQTNVEKSKESANSFYQLAEQKREEQIAILQAYSSELDNLTDYIVKVCETSPNAKIKALANDIKSKTIETKQELATKLEEIDSDIATYVKERNKVDELENKVNQLMAKLESLVNNDEERNNESEEE